jgi:hypothetical protein
MRIGSRHSFGTFGDTELEYKGVGIPFARSFVKIYHLTTGALGSAFFKGMMTTVGYKSKLLSVVVHYRESETQPHATCVGVAQNNVITVMDSGIGFNCLFLTP